LHAVVRGYVQGVGYRAFVQREGRLLQLDGWVRNRSDGAVEVVAEGPEERLGGFVAILERGPSEAEVQTVESRWEPLEGECAGFEIRY
jgi:acylphosphatase